jgi:catechol 2,3-dioxygenase-like lactoylglutathione lyase family enzyme
MQLLDDIHHLTFLSADLDRLIAFYAEVFDAPVLLDLREDGLRHVMIPVGPHSNLHAFQIPGIDPPGPLPMFQRGRLDHFALNAASEQAFRELYRRLVARGACDGEVTDMGPLLLFSFVDPDGAKHEVAWNKPGALLGQGGERAAWKRVEIA